MKKITNEKGFTLIEAVISMLILGIGTVAVTTMMMTSANIQGDAYKLTSDSSKSKELAVLGKYKDKTGADKDNDIKVSFGGKEITLSGDYYILDTTKNNDVELKKYSYFITKEAKMTKK